VTPITTRTGVVRNTGEVVDVEFPAAHGTRKKGKRKVFAMMDLEALDRIELSRAEWEVLTRIMRSVNPETNEAGVQIRQIALDVGMAQSNVSRIMKDLRDRRVVYTLRQGQHKVNPHIMFRGTTDDWGNVTFTHPEPIWRRP
jgi:DNA-binding transcriptional ArsR family regulator